MQTYLKPVLTLETLKPVLKVLTIHPNNYHYQSIITVL